MAVYRQQQQYQMRQQRSSPNATVAWFIILPVVGFLLFFIGYMITFSSFF